jgi:hypothetical protein
LVSATLYHRERITTMSERSQKDIDIARMSALKTAVELMSAFKEIITVDQKGVIPVALGIADSLLQWIYTGTKIVETEGHTVDTQTGEVLDERPRNNYNTNENQASYKGPDWFTLALKEVQQDPDFFLAVHEDVEPEPDQSGWIDRSKFTFGGSPGNPYPISKKQYGYLIGLMRSASLSIPRAILIGLSTEGASYLIDTAKANGVKNGKQKLNDIKADLRNRRESGQFIGGPRQ